MADHKDGSLARPLSPEPVGESGLRLGLETDVPLRLAAGRGADGGLATSLGPSDRDRLLAIAMREGAVGHLATALAELLELGVEERLVSRVERLASVLRLSALA